MTRWSDDPIFSTCLRVSVVALLLCTTFTGSVPPPRWESNLEKRYALQDFNRAISAGWMKQQGIVFLTPAKILLYQVNRAAARPKLAQRGPSGGAGNFLLNVKVVNAQDGALLNSMDLTTSGEVSRVVATRDGGFVVQAGEALYAYSPTFERTASLNLHFERAGSERASSFESWQMQASPSGEKLALMHEQVFSSPELLADNSIIHDGRAKVELQILNPATLQAEGKFTLTHTLAFWTLSEGVLFSSNPGHSYSDGQIGTLDFTGAWSAVRSDLPKEQHFCRSAITAIEGQKIEDQRIGGQRIGGETIGGQTIDDRRVAFFGCDTFTIFSPEGQALFSRTDSGCVFVTASAAGRYLALQCDRYAVEQLTASSVIVSATHADRIEVYDLATHTHALSVPLRGERAYYAMSAQGDLAVVDGAKLRVFHVAERK
jgi:hypothetical protein